MNTPVSGKFSKSATSYSLSHEALSKIESLHKSLGLSRASVIEMAIRKLWTIEHEGKQK